ASRRGAGSCARTWSRHGRRRIGFARSARAAIAGAAAKPAARWSRASVDATATSCCRCFQPSATTSRTAWSRSCTGLAAHDRGGAAIVLAGDGQDPPEEIPRLIAAWRAGNAIVWAEKRRNERLSSGTFHRLLRRLSGLHNLTSGGSDFFLAARPVIDVVNTL